MEPTSEQAEFFGLIWRSSHSFRLRVNDVVRIGDKLGRVIRVNECSAVVLINRRPREFKTRFDKQVRFQPPPVTIRISANSEVEIVNQKIRSKRKSR